MIQTLLRDNKELKKYLSKNYTNKMPCKECVALSKCTKTRYRIITDGENQKYSHIVDARTKANEDIVREHKCLVEHHSWYGKKDVKVHIFSY